MMCNKCLLGIMEYEFDDELGAALICNWCFHIEPTDKRS